jgi:hypothetical protein
MVGSTYNILRLDNTLYSLLTHHHKQDNISNSIERYGVGVVDGEPTDMMKAFVWEPSVVKTHILRAATEATTLILSIDYVLILPRVRSLFSSHSIFFCFDVVKLISNFVSQLESEDEKNLREAKELQERKRVQYQERLLSLTK